MVWYGGKLRASHAVKHGDVFRSVVLLAPAALEIGKGVVIAQYDIVALSVNGAGGGLYHKLAVAVAIEVPCDKLYGVSGGKEVLSHVDTPKLCAVHLVAIEEHIGGGTVFCGVFFVRGRPFKDYLVLAVTVHIAVRSVVGRVGSAIA